MTKDENIMCWVDKGGVTVVMNKEENLEKCNQLLKDVKDLPETGKGPNQQVQREVGRSIEGFERQRGN